MQPWLISKSRWLELNPTNLVAVSSEDFAYHASLTLRLTNIASSPLSFINYKGAGEGELRFWQLRQESPAKCLYLELHWRAIIVVEVSRCRLTGGTVDLGINSAKAIHREIMNPLRVFVFQARTYRLQDPTHTLVDRNGSLFHANEFGAGITHVCLHPSVASKKTQGVSRPLTLFGSSLKPNVDQAYPGLITNPVSQVCSNCARRMR